MMIGAAAILWGTSGLTATVVNARGVHPLTVSSWRMAIGAATLAVLLRPRGDRGRLSGGEWGRLTTVGVCLAAYQAFYFLAVAQAGVSIATLVALGLAPVLVAAGERATTGQPVAPATFVGIGLALIGLAAMVGFPQARPTGLLAGAFLAGGSALGYATLTLVSGNLSNRLGSQRLTVLTFALAALALVPVTWATVGLGLGGDLTVVAAMLYLGVVPTAVAYRLFFAGLPRASPSAAAVLVLLEPLVATGLAVAFLGERLAPIGWVGAVTLVAAVMLVSRSGARPDGA
jgi:drug/metabolite transporter, DME family